MMSVIYKNNNTKTRNVVCDKNVLKELEGIYNPTLREQMDKSIVSNLIETKKKFGMGVKKIKHDKFRGRVTNLSENLKKCGVLVNGIDRIWAADLVDMQTFSKFNCSVKYLVFLFPTSFSYD